MWTVNLWVRIKTQDSNKALRDVFVLIWSQATCVYIIHTLLLEFVAAWLALCNSVLKNHSKVSYYLSGVLNLIEESE